ncbi:MAG TPA: histidine kinase [Pseudonocardiaceae bacterium]|nr:histidine kinase [Pseudonocardiaceae bacterium]
MSIALRPITGGITYRRWAYLILGGALLVPYILAGVVLLPLALIRAQTVFGSTSYVLLILACIAVLIVLTSLIPAVRTVEATAVRELLGGPLASQGVGSVRSWAARWRWTAWFVLHIIVGGLVSLLTLFVPPAAVVSFTEPFTGQQNVGGLNLPAVHGAWRWAVPVGGLLALVCLVYGVALAGAVLARLAPIFLGPSAADRLAAVEDRARALAQRNRLARELHDSVGHALSVVSIQAGAAGRVLDTDPDFVRRALSAIEESARSAMTDLDHVLGLLREDSGEAADRTPQPTLDALDRLVTSTELTGVAVDLRVTGDLATVPPVVSREAYRIVQEGLTNVLRHAGKVPVTLCVDVQPDLVELTMINPLGHPGPDAHRAGRGGRGLPGMRERVTVLHGQLTAGIDGKCWRVNVILPVHLAHA